MANFIITFPHSDKFRRDGWVRVIDAKDVEQVKNFANHQYKTHYSSIYAENDFHEGEGYFPKGCLEEVSFRTWHDYVT